MKIVVVVDASPYTAAALAVAAETASSRRAELDVVGVVPSIGGGMEDHEISPTRIERHLSGMQNLAARAVDRARAYLSGRGATPSHACTLQAAGTIAEAVVEYACEEKADLIILGTGTDRSVRAGLGGAVAQIARDSPCSVVVVKSADRM